MHARPWTVRWGRLVARCAGGLLLAHSTVLGQEIPDWLKGQPLEIDRPVDEVLIDGVDRFLLAELDAARDARLQQWRAHATTPESRSAWIGSLRNELARRLGMRDPRHPVRALELVHTTEHPARLASCERFSVSQVRWPVVGPIYGEGLLLEPLGDDPPVACVVAIPDADIPPEQLVGIAPGVPPESQYARLLAAAGCRVVVPVLISRQRDQFAWHGRRADLTNREFLYRSAYELGRHVIGYEVDKVLAVVDWFQNDPETSERPVGVVGWGEGGMLALYAAVLDDRIDAALVSGYFAPRERIWEQPIDRNVFGLLESFGDAELAAMVAPRSLIIEAAAGPQVELSGGAGAPARLDTPPLDQVRQEWERACALLHPSGQQPSPRLIVSGDGTGPCGSRDALGGLIEALAPGAELPDQLPAMSLERPIEDAAQRMQRQMMQIDAHNQWLLRESPYVRQAFMEELDFTSLDAYRASIEPYREYFSNEVIGRFDRPLAPPSPRIRPWKETPTWRGYEVVLDVWPPDVIAYGILLVPRDLEPGERRPVVVCQHGLEGRCQDVIEPLDHPAYKGFAARLTEQGFITFAPQNLYRHHDRFRTLQRKANPLKKTLFSIIVPQHQQIVDWLQGLPIVDPERIALYGLSYGGKTAMRVPAVVTDYCLSICSADFNEWVDKNASTRNPHSYAFMGEYEIFEFDLGGTFNYAEMAALIAPRPFMVERGHFDGVASDETVAFEFAKVRHLYAARLGLPNRCAIEWFNGPHTIHGVGTFDFLQRHLKGTGEF